MTTPQGLVGLGLTGLSYLSVTHGDAKQLDTKITSVFTAAPTRYDRLVAVASDLGSVYAVAGASVVLAATGRRHIGRDVLASGLAAWGLAQAAKPLMQRARPYTDEQAARLVAVPHGSSWPSGHTAVATAIAATVAGHTRRGARIAGEMYALGVGVSRIRVGVHYASDILAGAGVGLVAAALTRAGLRHVQR